MHTFKLYVIGKNSKANSTIEAAKSVLESNFGDDYELEIVDALEDQQALINDGIFATPILLKTSPPPEKRVIGDLSDKAKISLLLELDANQDEGGPS